MSDPCLLPRLGEMDSTSQETGDTQVGTATPPKLEEQAGLTNVKKMGRLQAAGCIFMIEIGMGILSLPSSLQKLGLIPGIIAIIAFSLITSFSAFEILLFYKRYPHITNLVQAARIIGGPVWEKVLGVSFLLMTVLICASASITLSMSLNIISGHAMCTIIFVAIPCVVFCALCIPRSMSFVSKCSLFCIVSILSAVLIVMISLGLKGPELPAGVSHVKVEMFGKPTFLEVVMSLLNIAFAFAGNQNFITVMNEMDDARRDFMPAFAMEKCIEIPLYLSVAIVIYYFAGDQVKSPALGSAPPMIAKIAYGIVIPAILGTGLVMGHTGIKYLYTSILKRRGADGQGFQGQEVDRRDKTSWVVWISCGVAFWAVTFLVANVIPTFSAILHVTSAVFVAWFTFGLPAIMWLYINWDHRHSTPGKRVLTYLNYLLIAFTVTINGAGLYASLTSLIQLYSDPNGKINSPFTCHDNSLL